MSGLRILFEDDWLISVFKEAGELVIPADIASKGDVVLLKQVRDYLNQRVDALHRLDRPTSGLVLFSKDKAMTAAMSSQLSQGQVEKGYLALVEGHPDKRLWRSELSLVKKPGDDPKEAVTDFRVLECFTSHGEPLALVHACPVTGRFHQIRRHLRASGHPIIGDYRYAGIARSDQWGERLSTGTRMLLSAHSMKFCHPRTREIVRIEAKDALLVRVLDSLTTDNGIPGKNEKAAPPGGSGLKTMATEAPH